MTPYAPIAVPASLVPLSQWMPAEPVRVALPPGLTSLQAHAAVFAEMAAHAPDAETVFLTSATWCVEAVEDSTVHITIEASFPVNTNGYYPPLHIRGVVPRAAVQFFLGMVTGPVH